MNEAAAMRDRLETLEETNRQLRQTLAPVAMLPAEWKLSKTETAALLSLASSPAGFRSHDQLRLVMCRDGATSDSLINVRLSIIRRKLKPFGITILTRWGSGYELTPDSRHMVNEARR